MESFISRTDSRTIDAAYRTKHTAYDFGNLHTNACSGVGIALWNKE